VDITTRSKPLITTSFQNAVASQVVVMGCFITNG
jgi:hypothetical protein